jgi:hypothetical protein
MKLMKSRDECAVSVLTENSLSWFIDQSLPFNHSKWWTGRKSRLQQNGRRFEIAKTERSLGMATGQYLGNL